MKTAKMILIGIRIFLFCLAFPFSMAIYQLVPYVIKNVTCMNIIKPVVSKCFTNPLATFMEIVSSPYNWAFLIMQLVIMVCIVGITTVQKKMDFEVVGRTNNVHGGAYWGTEKDIDNPADIHLVKKKKLKKIVVTSMNEESRNENE